MSKAIELELKGGDVAPSFDALANGGMPVRLSDFKGRQVVLYNALDAHLTHCLVRSIRHCVVDAVVMN